MKSIIAEDVPNICFICLKYGDHLDVHHIYGGVARRQNSDKRRLVLHLCRECHGLLHAGALSSYMDYFHRLGQMTYEEKIGTREQFIEEFNRSYL